MEKVWLSSYPVGTPADINPDVYTSMAELFLDACHHFAGNIAYEQLGRKVCFGELHTLARNFAAFCQQTLGLRKGDSIGLMLPNVLQYPVALFGAWLAGLTVININPLATSEEVIKQLQPTDIQCILVLENFAYKVVDIKKQFLLRTYW